MSNDVSIRTAVASDASAVAVIYAHHVLNGTATFDTEPPNAAYWQGKIADVLARGWPFLTIERCGVVEGYAYATQFRDRAAYAHTCENSIYIADSARGVGWDHACFLP